MLMIQWHPDGLIYVREGGAIVYEGTKAEVEALIGSQLAPLPPGVNERQYFVGQFARDLGAFGQGDSFPTWPDGDSIVSKLPDFKIAHIAKQDALREAATSRNEPPPPPTQEQLEKMALRASRLLALRTLSEKPAGTPYTAAEIQQIMRAVVKELIGE